MKRTRCHLFAVVGAVVCLMVWAMMPAKSLSAQSGAPNGEWRTYGADLANTRYSPLDQINAGNFKNLEVAWRFKTDNLGPQPEFNLQSTPLVVNGVLYTTAGTRRAVVALNAGTGEMKWMYSLDEGKRGEAAPRRLSGRGLSYWTDGKEERIIYVTPGYQMIALNAATGRPVPDLRQGRHRRSEAGKRSGDGSDHRRDRAPRRADRRQRRRRRRRGPSAGRRAEEPAEREGLRPRIRRADRQAPLDLSHHPAARRVRQRHVAEGLVGLHRQHRQLGTDVRRRGAGPRLPRDRDADRRLLRRASAGRQPVRRQHRRAGRQDRQADLAFPDDPPRHLGLGPSVRADPRRHHGQRTDRSRRSRSRASRVFSTCSIARTASRCGRSRSGRCAKGDVPGEWYSPTQPFPTKPPAFERQGVRSTT